MDKSRKPNILYIFADQLSMKALRLYGNYFGVKTPNIEFLSENGVKFTNSYCSTPQCSPSRSSLLTGLYPHKTSVVGNIGTIGTEDLNPNIMSVGNYMKKNGYVTGYFGKWHLGTPIHEFGFEYIGSDEEDTESNFVVSELKKTADQRSNDMNELEIDRITTRNTLTFFDEQKDKQWFAMVSYINPHDIYFVENKKKIPELDLTGIKLPNNFYDDLSTKPRVQSTFRDEDNGKPLKTFTEDDWKYYIAYYYHLVEKIDREVGLIIDRLKQNGQYKNTIIIFSSDHGDLMASHRCPYKGPMMYDELIKIPLVISYPGMIPLGETREQLTVNTDIFPTICSLAGLDIPKGLDGISINDYIYDKSMKGRDFITIEYYSKQKWVNPIRTITDGKFKYNLYLSGEEELYNTMEDPNEMDNRARKSQYDEKRKDLRDELLKWMKKENDPFFKYINTDR